MLVDTIQFPKFTGIRCLMMPYIQGDHLSLPKSYELYSKIIDCLYFVKGAMGFLTIDESFAKRGKPHRASRAKFERALHTEAGRHPNKTYVWGGGAWGTSHKVTLDKNVGILLSNNIDNSCAVWNSYHENTSLDGDIGDQAEKYSYKNAILMKAGEVHKIGIFTPHESLPVKRNMNRQFLRIISSGVHGRESYFTLNPVLGNRY